MESGLLENTKGFKFNNTNGMMFNPNDTEDMSSVEILEDIKYNFIATFLDEDDYDALVEDVSVELYKGGEGYVSHPNYAEEISFEYY